MFLQKSPKFKTSSLCSQDTGSSNAIWTNNKQRKTNIHLSVKTRVHEKMKNENEKKLQMFKERLRDLQKTWRTTTQDHS